MTKNKQSNNNSVAGPKLLLGERDAIFLGVSEGQQKSYRIPQEILFIALAGHFTLTTGGAAIHTRSCLLPPGTLMDESLLDTRNAVIASCHLTPFSQDYPALAAEMTPGHHGIYYHHERQQAIIDSMTAVRDHQGIGWTEAHAAIQDCLFPPRTRHLVYRAFDPRVVATAKRIRETLQCPASLSELAQEAELSESRLEKLFKEEAGLTITQYRVRYRVYIGTIIMAMGYSMTEAALMAGFSNSAHLSRSFRQINGVTPSSTFVLPPCIEAILDTSVSELVRPFVEGQPVT